MNVETVAIETLSADPANVRKHGEGQITKLMGALKRWGQTLPLLMDENNVVRIGNARLTAMQRLGWTEVQVVRLELPPSEWTALSIADNKLHDESEFDQGALAEVVGALRAEDDDLAQAAGFTADELADLLGQQAAEPVEPPADFPEVTENVHCDYRCPKCGYAWSGKAAC